MEQQKLVDFWLENAKSDIEAAQAMQNIKHYMYVAFMCQQCVEKALKAYYIYQKDDNHPFTHNLIQLAQLSNLHSQMNENQRNILLKLNPFYIKARYADYKDNLKDLLTDSYCKKLIEETKELFLWIEQSMKS